MENEIDQYDLGIKALAGLLGEFREGNIANEKHERQALRRHLRELSERWDQRFPGFPQERYLHASFWGVIRRGVRDKYLKNIIVNLLEDESEFSINGTIVNPVCVIARHARDLASRLKRFKVIATDIDPVPNWLLERIRLRRNPANFEFGQDDIFSPTLKTTPIAVVFFGACGSISDGAIDYAIKSNSPYLMCRTCCHDNIGGNTRTVRRFTALNWAFRVKNFAYSKVRTMKAGFYFSDKYSKDHYPTSRAARNLSNCNEFLDVSRNSVDSDICRAIVDLDRYLRLTESGYNVWYKGELFIARKTSSRTSSSSSAIRRRLANWLCFSK
jgi:hypothetical protein